jgi:hypothetical protein
VVGLDGEEAEGWVRREQKLTGEEVVTARWFRRGSGHEKWPGSIGGVRESSPGGCSGQWEADGGGPRRTEGHRSGGRGRRWCSVLEVRAEKEKERNGKGLSRRSSRATKNE